MDSENFKKALIGLGEEIGGGLAWLGFWLWLGLVFK